MKELGQALKSIFDKISAFFDIFDLSFFISGAVSLSALVFWAHLAKLQWPLELQGWLKNFAIVLACYINGLVCFTLGRWLRRGWKQEEAQTAFNTRFERILKAHGLYNKRPFALYVELDQVDPTLGAKWRLYSRLWAELRQSQKAAPSLLFVNRLWVMAATYDGVGAALAVWALVFLVWTAGWIPHTSLSLLPGLASIGGIVIAARMCWREAGRYAEDQVEQLVATIAIEQSKVLDLQETVARVVEILNIIPDETKTDDLKGKTKTALVESLIKQAYDLSDKTSGKQKALPSGGDSSDSKEEEEDAIAE